jgi:hypothetical protein
MELISVIISVVTLITVLIFVKQNKKPIMEIDDKQKIGVLEDSNFFLKYQKEKDLEIKEYINKLEVLQEEKEKEQKETIKMFSDLMNRKDKEKDEMFLMLQSKNDELNLYKNIEIDLERKLNSK